MSDYKAFYSDILRLVQLFDEGKIDKAYPILALPINAFIVYHNPGPLLELLEHNPMLADEAETFIMLQEMRKKDHPVDVPYKPHHLASLNGNTGAIRIGTIDDFQSTFNIDINELCKNALILGMPGMGKTTLIRNLLNHIMQQSPEQRGFNVICFDTKGDYHPLLKSYPDTFYLNHRSLRYNFFEPIQGDDDLFHINTATEILCEENYFKALAQPLVQKPFLLLSKEMES